MAGDLEYRGLMTAKPVYSGKMFIEGRPSEEKLQQYLLRAAPPKTSTPKRPKPSRVALITVLVGPAQTMYRIPELKARSSSAFFDIVIARRSVKHAVRLPDIKPSTFEQYSSWLHDPIHMPSSSFRDLIDMYTLADRLLDTKLESQMVELLVTKYSGSYNPPSYEDMVFASRVVPFCAPLYRFLVDIEAQSGSCTSSGLREHGRDKWISFLEGSEGDQLAQRTVPEAMSTAMTKLASSRPKIILNASDYRRRVAP
ncbi:uncharacterized protein BP01DRAFT_403579 [Aspergillus saccharolyticus JOP 1030-1]|uniref:BTB domain-containing protein n=1 Tax=Aspergillus saccharolyticus JOP 1030-1 TaxID=1450539 RepID=A0A318ZMT5_9EURO|nr:hypothetical protein BP01DRAFT_403579 [Aspergillus saccharolyticus JOP 1030-1]PYH48909.1 hypothetical protein BP01DRAFT_403579 [Aspergillus saccharolyticus JOP 1030-1]